MHITKNVIKYVSMSMDLKQIKSEDITEVFLISYRPNCNNRKKNVLRRVPGYGPDRRGTWTLYFNLFLSILVTNAHHSIYHAQGEVLSIICPPLIIQIILI